MSIQSLRQLSLVQSLQSPFSQGLKHRFSSATKKSEDASVSKYIVNTGIFSSIAKQHIPSFAPYTNLEGFLKRAALASHSLPIDLRSALYNFKTQGNQDGYFLIRRLPCDKKLMDTPEKLEDVPRKKESFVSEFWLASIGGFLGDPFSYIQENKGNLFHNVRPDKEKANKLSSESSLTQLDLHSETAFHPIYPDWLLLFCLRGDRNKQAKTIVSSLKMVKPEISKELEQILRQPLFKTGIDYSFSGQNGVQGNGPTIPILYGDKEDPLIIFDPDLMLGVTDEAQRAVTKLKKIFDSKIEGILLEEGDLLLIDNHRAIHGRNQFTPFYDGKDRWLQRIYVKNNLFTHASKLLGKRERIITYQFPNIKNSN